MGAGVELPSPLLVARAKPGDAETRVWEAGFAVDLERTEAFAQVLARARANRELPQSLLLAVPTPEQAPDARPRADANILGIPHVFVWEPTGEVTLAWELLETEQVELTMEAKPLAVEAWARRPELIVELAHLALADRPASRQSGEHLSLRWIVTHERLAAEALSGEHATVDHVSLHVSHAQEDLVARALVEAVGLLPLTRPAAIKSQGRWLQCGAVRLHLNSRTARATEPGFPGTAPNHLCLRVGDVNEVEQALSKLGVETVRAGSLRQQLWWHLEGGTTIEFQQDGSVPPEQVHPDVYS